MKQNNETKRVKENIIFVPFAYLEKKQTGSNISKKDKTIEIYLKNASVALISAKRQNPTCTVAFITNLQEHQIPKFFLDLFEKHSIEVFYIPFDEFLFGDECRWGLAFYKLCALTHLIEEKYQNYCWLDADIWVQGPFEAIWEEVRHSILLYDINHGLNTKNYRVLCNEVQAFTKKEKYVTHFGGEFFAGNYVNTKLFIERAKLIFNEMRQLSFVTTKGDEFITSIVADDIPQLIKNAAPYIFRFWTSNFRLVSTCYQYNKVLILHVPDEKEIGMLGLFERYIKRRKIPKEKTVWRALGISRPHYVRLLKMRVIKLFFKRRRK